MNFKLKLTKNRIFTHFDLTLYKITIAALKVENEVSSWFRMESRVNHGCFLSPYMWVFMDFALRSIAKVVRENGIQLGT